MKYHVCAPRAQNYRARWFKRKDSMLRELGQLRRNGHEAVVYLKGVACFTFAPLALP